MHTLEKRVKSLLAQMKARGPAQASQRLKTVAFSVAGHSFEAIEQNSEKPSRWGQLARSGHQVVQFKDAERNRFVAVVVDDQITFYGGSKERRIHVVAYFPIW